MTNEMIDHTDQVTIDELRRLAKLDGPWVSITMPTHRTGPETRQDPIRFRNLASAAIAELDELGQPSEQIAAEFDRIGRDLEFWAHQTGGLVVLASPAGLVTFRLSTEVPERAEVAAGPALSALIPHLADDSLFRLLVLSQDSVRLLEGSINSLREVELGAVPADYEAAFGHVEHQKHLQHSSLADGSQYHGHGGDADQSRDSTTRYLRAVAAGLDERLRGEPSAPLLLAGMAGLASEFREISGQRKILEQTLTGSHEKTPLHELHTQAWPLVAQAHTLPIDEANETIEAAWARDEALLDLTEINRAAAEGRVHALFLAADAEAADDLEQAIRSTLGMGGELHTLAGAQHRWAALLRY